MTVIRSAGLRGFRATVAELGGDAEHYARTAGLPTAALDTDDLLVPERALVTTLETAAADLHRPDLGLRIAARQDLGMLGPLALAIRNSPTIGDALECATRYLFVHARALTITLDDDPRGTPGIAALRYELPPGAPTSSQAIDLGLGFLHRAITFLAAGRYGLRTAELPHTPAAPLHVYEEFFGAPITTGAPAALLRLPRSLTTRPLTGADERVRQLALAYLAERTPGESADLTTRVRSVLTQALGTTPPEIGAIAHLINLHPRTLQRRLRDEGTTFAALLDDARRHAAHRYLTSTDLPLGRIAALLGLSEQSALSRCCRRWWHTTPSDMRRVARSHENVAQGQATTPTATHTRSPRR
ncbi:AraC family transcriptional regulator [Saccharopolyspora gregorii]|nr:AraC family transcriptional regulator [Saccharopolyspora gregorii]